LESDDTGRMMSEPQDKSDMFPCGDHGEKIAFLVASLGAYKEQVDERHVEVTRKLDRIITAGEETNGRLGSLEIWRGAMGASVDQTKKMAESVENIQLVQKEQQGERRVWLILWGLAVALVASATSAIAEVAISKLWK